VALSESLVSKINRMFYILSNFSMCDFYYVVALLEYSNNFHL